MPKKESSNLIASTYKLSSHTRELIKTLSEKYGSQGTVIAVAVELLNTSLTSNATANNRLQGTRK